MAETATETEIDWMACELIEQVPGKVSGRPIVRGTRILPDGIVGSFDLGDTIEELCEGFPSFVARADRAPYRICPHRARPIRPVKVILDENLDHALRKLLGPHDVVTVTYMGWAGLKNGELLAAAETADIDVLPTGDQTLHLEQNLKGRHLAIVVLSTVRLPIIRMNLPRVIAAIDAATPGSFQIVECGTFSRKVGREK